METFTQTIAGWHDFYIMAGTAAATLVGLLFVGLSLNIAMIRDEAASDLRLLALLTFDSFFYVLLFAIFFLIPHQVPLGLGLPLLAIGGLGLLNYVRQYRRALGMSRQWGRGKIASRFILPIIALAGVVIISISVLLGQTDGLYWLVPAIILLLANASQNAWDLLLGARRTP